VAEKVARTRAVRDLVPDVLEIDAEWMDPPHTSFRAGQFISIRCGDPKTGDRNARRSYSIASLPSRSDGCELLVKLLEDGVGSEFFRRLRPGDPIPFTGPMGFFTCELQHPGDAVFCATGTGIAAALPMMQETLARPQETGRVRLFWGMRNQRELYWLDRLAELEHPRFSHEICLSRPENGWPGRRDRINAHVLAEAQAFVKPTFYLVGNGDMVREMKQALIDLGFDRKRQIRIEVFYPASK